MKNKIHSSSFKSQHAFPFTTARRHQAGRLRSCESGSPVAFFRTLIAMQQAGGFAAGKSEEEQGGRARGGRPHPSTFTEAG
ncbi:hypothetical protein E2C01_051627 [Portunus trituberculatus]|uniref:Uncharacterized protein n=1 Tax=Portunus trituberculatus TaxID=210409 RepID=A0A5B7GFB4_PORTR|nr:hypothetical protein [Portunus trituberculatus]